MAAPTYFGSACNQVDNATGGADADALTVTPPPSMVAGDLVLLIGQLQVTTAGQMGSVTFTGGQSWSSASAVTGANDQVMVLYWCQFNGTWSSDPGIQSAAQSGTQPFTIILHVFRPSAVGAWTVDVAIAGGAEASQDPMVVSDVTPTKSDNVSIAGICIGSAVTVASVSGSGWVLATIGGANQMRNLAGGDQTAALAYRLQGSPAATANASFDLSTASTGISFTMVWYNFIDSPPAPLGNKLFAALLAKRHFDMVP
jgi:hypothetical protein